MISFLSILNMVSISVFLQIKIYINVKIEGDVTMKIMSIICVLVGIFTGQGGAVQQLPYLR